MLVDASPTNVDFKEAAGRMKGAAGALRRNECFKTHRTLQKVVTVRPAAHCRAFIHWNDKVAVHFQTGKNCSAKAAKSEQASKQTCAGSALQLPEGKCCSCVSPCFVPRQCRHPISPFFRSPGVAFRRTYKQQTKSTTQVWIPEIKTTT